MEIRIPVPVYPSSNVDESQIEPVIIYDGQGLEPSDADLDDSAEDDYYPEDMDGDHDSAMASAGLGMDEDYGNYGNDFDDFWEE